VSGVTEGLIEVFPGAFGALRPEGTVASGWTPYVGRQPTGDDCAGREEILGRIRGSKSRLQMRPLGIIIR